MSRERMQRLAAVLFAFAAALLTGASWLGGGPSPQGEQPPPEPVPFHHNQHVERSWLNQPEVFRDCRGCHRFSAANLHSSPQAECTQCHVQSGALELRFDADWRRDLAAAATRTGPAFRHHTHGMLECKQCHEPQFLTAHVPVSTGPALCAECHGRDVTPAKVQGFRWFGGLADSALAKAVGLEAAFTPPATEAELAAYVRRLDAVFGGSDGGINRNPLPPRGDFDHADHIDVRGGDDGIACAVCHNDIERASATDAGTGVIPVDGCARCHVRDAAGSPATASPNPRTTEPRPLWTLGTFAHRDHLAFVQPGGQQKPGVASQAAHDQIAQQACAACHAYAPEVRGVGERDFPFEGGKSRHTYRDCIACHDQPGWQTGEGTAAAGLPPLHSSGGGSGWRECAACHDLGEPDMAGRRPQVAVQRRTQSQFVFEGQTHPHVSLDGVQRTRIGGGEVLQQECAKCHRAEVPALPSRLIAVPFRHATHLPPAATGANCVGCHPRAATASTATSAALADDAFRTYTLDSCAACHWGSRIEERAAGEARERMVVAFPHGPHVAAGQSCTECHEPAADGGDIVTKPAALACNQCHQHEAIAGGARPPEKLLAAEVQSCVRCHHEPVGGKQVASVPPARGSERAATDPRYRATQSTFAGFVQSQFHPAGSDCTECHKAKDKDGKFAPIVLRNNVDHLLAVRAASVHADVREGGFGRSEPAACLRCHWKPVGAWDQAVRIGKDEPAGSRSFRLQPGSPATRAKFGNAFAGYPGGDDADG